MKQKNNNKKKIGDGYSFTKLNLKGNLIKMVWILAALNTAVAAVAATVNFK